MHVPVEVAERARAVAAEHGADVLVCVGGGSTTGLAKAVALTTGLPIVAVPTTYAGSEATNVWGLTEDGRKTTGVDRGCCRASVVYDASADARLPVRLSVASGLNALAHCVDSMWAPRTDPIDQALAAGGHPGPARRTAARSSATRRSWRAASRRCTAPTSRRSRSRPPARGCTTRSATSSAACSTCRTPQTHAVVLPYVLAFNAPAAPDARRADRRRRSAPTRRSPACTPCASGSDAPRALRDLGLQRGRRRRGRAADPAGGARRATRRPSPAENLEALLRAAWAGAEPMTEMTRMITLAEQQDTRGRSSSSASWRRSTARPDPRLKELMRGADPAPARLPPRGRG